jgi:alanine-glyoxylate transaminase / serine-glyoxylate transaminase / serine-pyruvate transaminase
MLITADPRLVLPKRFLFGPGPSVADPRVCEAMSQPVLGIRDPVFIKIMDEIRAGLRSAFGTANLMTFPVPASGSGAMETAVVNFVPPGSKLAVFAAGHFADRMSIIAARHGAVVVRCEKEWGEVFSEGEAREFLERERPQAVTFVQAETSTGAYQSGHTIATAAKGVGALVIADTVTSLGAMPVELDEVGIDVTFSCSQKGLSCPAGLSPISVSPAAWEQLLRRLEEPASWYLDLKLIAKYLEPPHVYHHTPSPPLHYAMHQALAVIEEEGLENRFRRHRRAHEQLLAGLEELGFEPVVKDPAHRIWHVTAVYPPEGVNEAQVRQRLFERHDIEIGPGIGKLGGKVLRIGTMGPLATEENVALLLDALRECL